MTKSSSKPKKATGTVTPGASGGKTPKVAKQPQSKPEAAAEAHLYLHTDDAWSQAYFNKDDLHYMERTLFAKH
jgi:hypothetical protein